MNYKKKTSLGGKLGRIAAAIAAAATLMALRALLQ